MPTTACPPACTAKEHWQHLRGDVRRSAPLARHRANKFIGGSLTLPSLSTFEVNRVHHGHRQSVANVPKLKYFLVGILLRSVASDGSMKARQGACFAPGSTRAMKRDDERWRADAGSRSGLLAPADEASFAHCLGFQRDPQPAEADISGPQGKSEDQPPAKQIAPGRGCHTAG
jgi:hypothetical protein